MARDASDLVAALDASFVSKRAVGLGLVRSGAADRVHLVIAIPVGRYARVITPAARSASEGSGGKPCQYRAKLSSKAPVAQAIDYMLKRWTAFCRFLDNGRICLSNNAAERAIRPIAVGRRN